MRSVRTRLGILLSCFVCFGLTNTLAAEIGKPVHAMIVFDVSGSMKKSDPARSSVAAARLFSDLARADDAIGLAAFSGTATPLVPVTSQKAPLAKVTLQAQLANLRFTGATTNLLAALEVGLAAFPLHGGESQRKIVLLLTDGQLDLGKDRKSEESLALARIEQTLIPQYRRRGIALYTIAFTAGADRALLEQMADGSGGEFRFIADATMLHEVFSQMFIGGQDVDSFPLEQDSMLVDSSVQSLSLVFEKGAPDERIALVTPGKQTMRQGEVHPGAEWRSTPTYDVVNLSRPESGEWQIERSGGAQKGVGIIAESTRSLQVELGSTFIETGSEVALRAFLLDESTQGDEIWQEAGQAITAEITAPNGKKSSLDFVPNSDGSFAAATPLLQAPGKYRLTVTAASPTLKRQRTTTFVVHPECLQASVGDTLPVSARVVVNSACPAFTALKVDAEYGSADGEMQRVALRANPEGVYEADIPPLTHGEAGRVLLHFRGERSDSVQFALTKGPWSIPGVAPPVPRNDTERTPEVARVVNKVLYANGLLVLLGAIGYASYRYGCRKAKVVNGRKPDLDSNHRRRGAASR